MFIKVLKQFFRKIFISYLSIIDNPPSWLKQSDLYKEYKSKSEQINMENISTESPPHHYQQLHRKQRCNLQMYARSSQSWQSLPSPPLLKSSVENHSMKRNHSNDSVHKPKCETNMSPMYISPSSPSSSSSSSMMDLSMPLDISVKSEPDEQSSLNKSKSLKSSTLSVTTRRQKMLSNKKVAQNGTTRRHQRMNSVEDQGKKIN